MRQILPYQDGAMQIVFDETNRLLSEMVHGAGLRHRILSGNLANVDTPGYEPKDASFAAALTQARQVAGVGGTVQLQTNVVSEPDGPAREDGNTVQLDRQMAKLAQNTLWHNSMLQMLSTRMAILKSAIKGS
jgi:flagellar basal-body rod protein FlgB